MPSITELVALLALCLAMAACASFLSNPDPPSGAPAVSDKESHYYNFILSEIENRHNRTDQAIEYMEKAVAGQPESVYLKKELAYLYLEVNNMEKALETTEAILSGQPEDIEALTMAGTIKKELGQEEEAASIFETILALNPEEKKIYHILGEYYIEENDFEKAAGVYERMTDQFPESWEGFFFLGRIRARQKKFSDAEKNFLRCLELEKSLVSPRFELIKLYKQQAGDDIEITVQTGDTLFSLCRKHYGKYDDKLAEKIIAVNPDLPDAASLKAGQKLILPGTAQIHDGFYHEKIINLYNSILKDHSDNHGAAMELALYYYSVGDRQRADDLLTDLGRKSETDTQFMLQHVSQYFISRQRYDDARIVLTGLLRGAPDDSDLNYLLGLIYDKQQQKTDALRHFSRIKKDSMFYTSSLLQMAFLYEETEQPEQAESIFDLLLEKDPESIEILLYAGSFLERREQYEQAEKLYLQGLDLDSKNTDLLFRLGVIYDKMGQKEAVIEKMKAVLEIVPEDANALNYLGYTYAEMGIKLDEAQQMIEKALQIDPDNGYITDSLGWVYYKKGEIEKAIELLTRAVSLSPDDSILLEHLGDAYIKNGNTDQALEAYQRSLKLAPDKDKEKITEKVENILQPVDMP